MSMRSKKGAHLEETKLSLIEPLENGGRLQSHSTTEHGSLADNKHPKITNHQTTSQTKLMVPS